MPPQTLVAAVRDRTVVPFVGSGLSVSVGRHIFPDWSGLIERLAGRLVSEGMAADAAAVRTHLASKRFPEAAELAFEKLTPVRFGAEMQAAFDIPPPHGADLSAVEALWRLRPTTVITTNYDAVLRWPFAARGDRPYQRARVAPRIVHNDDPGLLQQLVAAPAGDRASIWHLHGSVERPGTIILTQHQYERLYGAGSRQVAEYAFALDQLRSVVANRTLLFVGFSLDDPFVRAQLDYIFALTAKQKPLSFVLLKKGQKDAAALLAAQHVQIIEFDDFGPPMVRAIAEIADEAWGPAGSMVSVPGALVGLVDDLKNALRRIAPPPAIVGRAFNRWRPRSWPAFPLGGDGVELALDGADRLANAMRQETGFYPLIEFAREILLRAPAPDSSLQQWLAQAAAALGIDAGDAARLEAGGFEHAGGAGDGDYYVLLRLDASGADKWRGQGWLFSGTETWKLFPDEKEWARGDFPALVYDLLDCIEVLELPAERTTVGFMVPRALLVEAIDQLEPTMEFARERPIGVRLAVTVRSVERLGRSRNMRRLAAAWQALKTKAGAAWPLQDGPPATAATGAVWLQPSDAGPELAERLEENRVLCVVLAMPPQSEPADGATDLFNCVLQAAVPAVIWLREPAATDLTAARASVSALLDEATPPLPQRIWRLRRDARGGNEPTHPGHCVALLWDDAERLPPDQDPINRAGVPRA